jgi:hypothetical protein
MIEQIIGGLPIVALSSSKAQSDWEALRIDDRVDFGREPASGATETMISPPFCRRGLLVGANGCAVNHLDVAIVGSGDGVHHPIPNPAFRHRAKRL